MVAACAIAHIDIERVGLHNTSHADHFFDSCGIKTTLCELLAESLIPLRHFMMAQGEITSLECIVGARFAQRDELLVELRQVVGGLEQD